jgi:hypothetical protein
LQLENLILQLATCSVECISDGDVSILVPSACRRVASDVDMLAAWHRRVNANTITVALVVAVLGPPDHHACRRDAIVETLEPVRLFADCCLERI